MSVIRCQQGLTLRLAISVATVAALSLPPKLVFAQPLELRASRAIRIKTHNDKAPVVPVKINDQGPFWFELDTGATATTVSPNLCKKLGVIEDKEDHTLHLAGGEKTTFRYGLVKSIQVSDARIETAMVIIRDMYKTSDCEGVLGMSFLRSFQFRIDFPEQNLFIPIDDAVQSKPNRRKREIPFRFNSERNKTPIIDVTINGKGPYSFLVDTGAGATVLSPKIATEIGVLGAIKGIAEVSGGKAVSISYGTAESIQFGDCFLRSEAVAICEMPTGAAYVGLLGTPILSRYRMTLNSEKLMIAFE